MKVTVNNIKRTLGKNIKLQENFKRKGYIFYYLCVGVITSK